MAGAEYLVRGWKHDCIVFGRMKPDDEIRIMNAMAGYSRSMLTGGCSIHERLARSMSQLHTIQLVRDQWQDSIFGTSIEDCIVWRELVELELHEIDEQVERILAAAGEP